MAPTALGSNSLIDLVVFGRATGLHLKETLKPNGPHKALAKDSADLALARVDHFRNAKGGSPTAEVRSTCSRRCRKHAAVFRDTRFAREGWTLMQKVNKRMEDIGHRPQPDLEHRPDRNARARQSDEPGRLHDRRRKQPQGKPRRPCA
jgi:succinate dehydrogenase/fumarate reductase flavoprotein subunit